MKFNNNYRNNMNNIRSKSDEPAILIISPDIPTPSKPPRVKVNTKKKIQLLKCYYV